MLSRRSKNLRNRKLEMESFEPRDLLSAVPFSGPNELGPVERSSTLFSTSLVDLDSDGDLDILTQSKSLVDTEPRFLSWHLNRGDGTFSEAQRESPSSSQNGPFWLADIEGDGDKDVVRLRGDYVVSENQFSDGGTFEFESGREFRPNSLVRDIADFNGDGKDDFLTYHGWAENLGDSIPPLVTLDHELDGFTDRRMTPLAMDIDGDGDIDIVRQKDDTGIVIHRNIGGDDVFAPAEFVEVDFGSAEYQQPFTFDFDHDGDEDLFFHSTRPTVENDQLSLATLLWLENTDGVFGNASVRRFSDPEAPYPSKVFMQFDATGDGQLDLIFDSYAGSFGRFDSLSDAPWIEVDMPDFESDFAATGDIDGDGDLDWLGASHTGDIQWYDSVGADTTEHVVTDALSSNIGDLTAADFDNDGDDDLLYVRDRFIFWVENLGDQAFMPERVVVETTAYPFQLLVADITGDGVVDISYLIDDEDFNIESRWHRNLGNGNLGDPNSLPDGFPTAVLDLDGDGDQDLHWLSSQGYVVRLNNGVGDFETEVAVPTGSLTSTDVDQDGELDLVTVQVGKVAWHRNLGDNTFGSETIVATGDVNDQISLTTVFDADGDGDSDIIVARSAQVREGTQRNQVFENQDGQFVLVSEFEGGQSFSYRAIRVVDLDNDGDPDLVGSGSPQLSFIENQGNLQFETAQAIPLASGGGSLSLVAADFDGDGDYDLATVNGDQLVWHQSLLVDDGPVITPADVDRVLGAIRDGDSDATNDWNQDGIVDQADVAFLLQTYPGARQAGDADLDGRVTFRDFLIVSNNFGSEKADWAQGDFDGDGAIGFADFLALSANFDSAD